MADCGRGIIRPATGDDRHTVFSGFDASVDDAIMFVKAQCRTLTGGTTWHECTASFVDLPFYERLNAGTSNAPSRNGVTKAGIDPENMLHSFTKDSA
jgi:hypothetical protein